MEELIPKKKQAKIMTWDLSKTDISDMPEGEFKAMTVRRKA